MPLGLTPVADGLGACAPNKHISLELRLWGSNLHVVLFERLMPLGLMPVANALGGWCPEQTFYWS